MKNILSLLILLFLSQVLLGQVTITGLVDSDDEPEGVIGANVVVVDDNSIGTVTDYDGSFSLEVDSLPVRLEISYTGYETKIVLVGTKEAGTITLGIGFICDLPDITVIDSRLTNSASYTTLNKERLIPTNSASILGGMNTAPGIHIHSGALNTNRITIRGIGNRSPFTTAKIRAYLDGIPLTSGVGETSLEDIDVDALAEVKIIKGPNVSNYGSGLGGAIIMETKNNSSWNFLDSRFELGSNGYLRNSNSFNFNKNIYSLYANYSKTHSDGYRDNNEYDRHSVFLNQGIDLDEHQLKMLFNHTDVKAFIPSSLNEDDYLNNPTNAAFSWANVKGFEDYKKTRFGIYHTYNQYKYKNNFYTESSIFGTLYDAYESRPFNILDDHSFAFGARSKSSKEFSISNVNALVNFGAEVFFEKYTWQIFETLSGEQGGLREDLIENRNYQNIFSDIGINVIKNLKVELGFNINFTQYQVEDKLLNFKEAYRYEPVLSPRFGMNYYWKDKGISFYTNASHGFNAPTLEETLLPDGSRNLDIQPEKGWSYEIGTKGEVFRNKLNYNLSAYYMHVQDLLVAKRIGIDQFQSINAGNTIHKGIEIDLNYNQNFGKGSIIPFVNYHFAKYTFKEFIDGDDDFSGNELTGASPHKINAGLRFNTKIGINGNALYQYVGQMPMRDDNSIYSDAYQTMDIRIGYEKYIEIKENNLILSTHLGIRNIFNEKYASQILINASSFGGNAPRYYYPGLPRNYYGGLSVKYRW